MRIDPGALRARNAFVLGHIGRKNEMNDWKIVTRNDAKSSRKVLLLGTTVNIYVNICNSIHDEINWSVHGNYDGSFYI